MNNILRNTVLSICAVGLLAGCASKDVEYEDRPEETPVVQKEVADTTDDAGVDGIAGSDEQVVSDTMETTTNSTNENLQLITNQSVNNVQSDIDGQVVILESIHFGFDKYNLTDEMREVATTNYSKIEETKQSYADVKIKLEGNCDEWGTDEYNYALGLKRAKTVKDSLIADGISADKILMVSFGESNPICTQKTTACWKMNRRVDYRLLP
ncbi:MAG: OmpA family protein [Campylobacterota bacterium]|nr:OmpA family protein [Campylobacterota bacterium]